MSATLVTGLWDVNREKLKDGWSRSFERYLDNFSQLMDVPYNLIIFGEKELEEFVFKKRDKNNTQFIIRESGWFKNEFYKHIQQIRQSDEWRNQSGWLKDSTQSQLEMYNPLVMSKTFLLHDAKLMDVFDSTHLFWIDAGITNTVHPGYFTKDLVIDKLKYIDKFTFIAFPYKTNTEIHGFEYNELCKIAGREVDKVCRGGFFGGPKDTIGQFNAQYYDLMDYTLKNGYMGTEESLFTILLYKHSNFYQHFKIDENGLLYKFFEDLKNGKYANEIKPPLLNTENTALYVLGFNSPKQTEKLFQSFVDYDRNFIEKPKCFLLDNSNDLSTTPKYKKICEKYNITHIKKDNLGICGGRQFIAEHAEQHGFDYYFFFEDDMFLSNKDTICKNGFNTKIKDLYDKSLEIMKKEDFDFLKLSFTEFYGDNSVQWSWYNVPQEFREIHWPHAPNLPEHGLYPHAPKTIFKDIKSHKHIPYTTGEIYYCNWPQLVSKFGNRKMFLNTKFQRPFEQTWMSFIYQEILKDKIKPGLLLASPIEHVRFDHYDKHLRKENT